MSDTSYRRTSNVNLIQACLAIALILAYLSTRLTNLALLPIFTDEAVYILWSQNIAKNISELWLPVRVENNRPLFFWLIAISLKAIADPLMAGRIVSVLAGFYSLAGVYFISCRLHSKWAGLLAGFVYVASPYHLFFDRMAHKAALLECFFVWLVWLTLCMVQPGTRVGAWQNLLLGLLVALSLLTEATAILFVLLPLPFMLFFSKITPNWKPVISCYLLAFAVGAFPYAYLYFMDDHYQVKNIFIPAFNSMAQTGMADMILEFPRKIAGNAKGVLDHFMVYLTWPVVISAIFYFAISSIGRNHAIMSAYFFLPVLALMGTAGAGFSRYYLFCATLLLIWGSLGMAEIFSFVKRAFSRRLAYFVLATGVPLIFMPAGTFDLQLLTSPQHAPLSETDQYQYISSEYSGYGSSEAIDYLKKMSRDKKIAVFTTSNWGVPDDCATLYLAGSPNIDVFMGYWAFKKPLLPPDLESFDLYDKFTAKHLGKFNVQNLPQDVYFITRTPSISRSFFLGMNDNFQLIQSFRKPIGTNTVDIYKLIRS